MKMLFFFFGGGELSWVLLKQFGDRGLSGSVLPGEVICLLGGFDFREALS